MILWLTGKTGIPPTTKALLLSALGSQGIVSSDIIFNSLHIKVPSLGEYPAKKCPALHLMRAARQALENDVKLLKPNLIVVTDEATLRTITETPYTLNQVRGSVYPFHGIPVLIFDTFKSLWTQAHGKFIFGLDLSKLVRLAKGQAKYEPPFDFHICRTVEDVILHCGRAKNASFVAEDTETRGGIITVISFTYDYNNKLFTFAVPFVDPYNENGSYWQDERDEVAVRKVLMGLQNAPVYKAFQNGSYDCAYLIKEGLAPVNYLLDTANMMHAIWCEAPKALHEISSYFVDCYQYWKDESKGVKEDGYGKSRADVERYWRYNGLDTYYLWLATRELLSRLVQLPWAMRNYETSFALNVGPCLAASLRGLKISRPRHVQIMAKKSKEAEGGLADIRRLVDDSEFNPNSSRDVAWFIYDVLGEKPTRLQTGKRSKYGPRSTDEKVLKLIKERGNIITNNFIDRLLKAKKPAADISKYGHLDPYFDEDKKRWKKPLCKSGFFLSWSRADATKTARFNSGESQFWCGTNAQNIPAAMREMMVAPDGYVFLELDYGASDDRFIAYESEDPDKIETVEDKTKDIHCKHCAIFFSLDYDKVYAGWKAEEDWVVDSTKGVRQNTKRVTHGRNYLEGAETMYNVMGRDAVVATALALGHTRAAAYTDKELIGVCATLIDKYDHPVRGMYKRIRPWQGEICQRAAKNGNLATFAGGFTRKFFGDLVNDHRTQRELASCYGQSGTAGNINRALRLIFFGGKYLPSPLARPNDYETVAPLDDGTTCLFVLQVHDSLLFLIHKSAIDRVTQQVKKLMELPQVIHGREMRVPTDPKVGLTWSKKMLTYKPGITYDDVVAFEKKTFGEKYKQEYADAIIQQAAETNVDLGAFADAEIDNLENFDDIEIPEGEQDDVGAPNEAVLAPA